MGEDDPREPARSALEELVVAVLARLDADGGALEDACREHPELAGELRRRVATLAELGLLGGSERPSHPERLGDFQLLERIGVGGMGVVYHAFQTALERDVALKVIRPEMLYLAGARERFARETRIVARLQHPGIVPIYTVGVEGELPYYAMERVPGCTLAEALAELGRDSSSGLSGADLGRAVCARSRERGGERAAPSALYAGSWEETALRIAREVAEALEHAHGRGVLHRDLKPSNVMLTPGGRVLLVDFGLSQGEGVDAVTRSGERAGSLPYMPPELLQSGLQALERRSDVYSLGVTLYQLLTLRLPFVAASPPALIASIVEGRPRRPRALVPGLSWEAETIALVALERDPDRRYATAADLARDLENALEHRPVSARRAGALLRGRRWVQRHPGGAAALLLALALPTLVAFLQLREARGARELLKIVQASNERAEADFERAIRAIGSMLEEVGAKRLDDVPGLDAVRSQLLGEARRLYAEAAEERPDDARVARLGASCALLEAGLLQRQGREREAEAAAREALRGLDRSPGPPDLQMRSLRARADGLLAQVAEDPSERAERVASALAAFEALQREHPDDARVRRDLVEVQATALVEARIRGERVRPPVELDSMEELARRCLADEPGADSERLLARVLAARAFWSGREGHPEAALAPLEEAVELRRKLSGAEPRNDDERAQLVEVSSALSLAYFARKRPADALAVLDRAVLEARRNHDDYPEAVHYAYQLVDVELNRSAALGMLGRRDEQGAALEEAEALQRELIASRPDDARDRRTLGTILLNLAGLEAATGEPENALATCDEARASIESAVELAPRDPDVASWRAVERITRAGVLLRLDRAADAAETLADAPALAEHRADRAADALRRMASCVQRARAADDAVALARVSAAARDAVELAQERGDLEGDAALEELAGLLAEN